MIRRFAAMKCPIVILLIWMAVGLFGLGSIQGQSMHGAPADRWRVGRATNDREADLIDALTQLGRFDDAESICRSRLQGADRQSDLSAKWVIRQSQIRTTRQMSSKTFEESDVEHAQQPIIDLLKAYPAHRRRLFLEAQNLSVQREAALHRVLGAAVSQTNDAPQEAAFKQLLRATTAVLSLAGRVGDARSKLESGPAAREFALVADLLRLQQELQVDAVSMALMQTELFPRGSDDCIAAATKAEEAADEAIGRLSADTPARREVERLKVEAIFRAGQLGRAEAALGQLLRGYGEQLPPRLTAMQIRVDLAKGDVANAKDRAAAFYGDDPAVAPRSIEMDLARLEILMRGDQGSDIGAWLDMIEQRGGAYARRRAEAVSLASLRRNGRSQSAPQMVDPSLIAAQGQDWLRRGEPARAGDLLSAAAAAEADPDRAIRHATKAAAALVSADRTMDAAKVLSEVPISKPAGRNAAAAHLQAAVLISSANLPQSSANIEHLLRTNIDTWPASEASAAARIWLLKLLRSQDRHVDAAEIATQIPIEKITPDDADNAVRLWRTAFRSIDPTQFLETTNRFEKAFRAWLDRKELRSRYVGAATLLLDRDFVKRLPNEASGDSFIDALRAFRRSAKTSDVLQSPPAELIEDASWRLMRDGHTDPETRKPIAKLLDNWEDSAKPSMEQAERLLWIGKDDESINLLRRLVDESPRSVDMMTRAAELLGSVDSRKALESAIQFWDQLAAGTAQGSRTWHQAKLKAIGLLQRTGKQEEASRRAKYILLTKPNLDAAWKQQYEAAVK